MRICTRIFWGVCILLGICVPAYATNVGGTISANTVWSVANSPYVVTSNVTVNSSVTLTIEPGVSVYFSSGTRLYVNGTINCSGTSADGIYFGSALELNTPSTAAPGDWSGIVIASGISSVLSYCTVAYATNGIYANDSAAPTITNCTSSNNSLYPISVYPDGVYKTSGNSGIGNGSGDVIAVRGGDITTSQTWITQPLSYRVTGDIVVYGVQNDPTQPCVLTLDAGVAVRFNSSCGLDIGRNHYGWWYGALACAGTEGNGVLLSSSSDSPAAGSWQGVRFYAGTRSDLSNMTYTTVEYGGQGTNGGINCYSSNPTISNCTLQYNSSHGIYADDSASPTITGCSLNNNSAYPIYIHPNYVYNTSGNSGIGNGSGDVIAVRGGDITTSQTWIAQPLTYRVIGDIVVYGVQNDSTQPSVLTLDAGAVVRFNSNCGLDIGRDHYGWWYGALACAGTEGNGVLLSSSSDSPAAGSWQGVRFYAGTRSDLSNMTYTTVEYGGQGTNGGINCYSSNPTISNCTLQYNSGYGIYSDDGAVPYIADCVLNSNGSYPISVYCNNIQGRLTGNTGSGNVSGDYIAIRGGSVTTSQSWIPQPLVYRVTGNVNVYGVQNDEAKPSILTLPSGTTVKFNSGCGLYMGREF
ncbi:MAG: right-handed parallel beta-helix repeat-containing protein, partial [Armatimonadota bacterium]